MSLFPLLSLGKLRRAFNSLNGRYFVIRRSFGAVLAACALTITLGACGGGSDSDDSASNAESTEASSSGGPTVADGVSEAANNAGSESVAALPAIKGPKMVATQATMRLVNLAVVAGKPIDIDLWMGTPGYGEKVATIAAGTTSDEIALKVTEGKDVSAGFDGHMTLMPKDDVDLKHTMQSSNETWLDGEKRILVAGSGEAKPLSGSTQFGIFQSWIYLDGGKSPGVASPPTGKASVFVSATGLYHLRPDDFVVPGVVGTCFAMDNANTTATGNLGSAFFIDPGTYDLALFDANTECATPLGEAASTTVAAGDRYVLLGTGFTKETRTALLLKV